jgi:hypothetical protein
MATTKEHDTQPQCYRFDSVRELVRCCRLRYGTLDVHALREDHSLWVKIGLGDGQYTRLLVVHFEGERAFVVGLPEPKELRCAAGGVSG